MASLGMLQIPKSKRKRSDYVKVQHSNVETVTWEKLPLLLHYRQWDPIQVM